ncbi:MAG: ABC transporter permease [Acidimicrobiia bacterium]|nr:ABC transporter permease [Acidimicrobiia bacterium]
MQSFFDFVGKNLDNIAEFTLQHILLVYIPVITATVVAVTLGSVFRHNKTIQNLNLGVASVLITIPSLALFSITIPIVGLGFWPPAIALFLYALLPVLRNTATGLAEVDQAVLESAKGMGMESRKRLFRIELPLAWPVILAGVRVSFLMAMGIAAIAALVDGGGLGEFIKDGLARYPLQTSVERIWTGTIGIILLALITDWIIGLIGRRTTPEGIRA